MSPEAGIAEVAGRNLARAGNLQIMWSSGKRDTVTSLDHGHTLYITSFEHLLIEHEKDERFKLSPETVQDYLRDVTYSRNGERWLDFEFSDRAIRDASFNFQLWPESMRGIYTSQNGKIGRIVDPVIDKLRKMHGYRLRPGR